MRIYISFDFFIVILYDLAYAGSNFLDCTGNFAGLLSVGLWKVAAFNSCDGICRYNGMAGKSAAYL